jgi:hypothetical protein
MKQFLKKSTLITLKAKRNQTLVLGLPNEICQIPKILKKNYRNTKSTNQNGDDKQFQIA